MTPEQYQRAVDLFHAALELTAEARPAFLADASAGDVELSQEVQSMLNADAKSGAFLDQPADDLAALAMLPGDHGSLIGQRFLCYEVVALLGAGGMGVVYRARDSKLKREVAIKVLPAALVNDPDRMSRFQREAQVLASLNHPNIATIYGLEEWNGLHALVMELVDGPTLAERIGGRRMPLEQALPIAKQMAEALEYAHTKGIIHRDLKPANVKITPEGVVKLLDFGLAKAMERPPLAEGDPSASSTTSLTAEGAILGTPAYMSPEQAEGRQLNARNDIFTFGSVLYEMLTGRRAFSGDSNATTIASVLRDTPAPLNSVRAHVPADLDRILWHCLEKDRDARYSSATELLQDLIACQSRIAAYAASWRSTLRRPRIAIAALGLLMLLLAGAAWVSLRVYRDHWVTAALPEIMRLSDQEKSIAAFRLARQVDRYVPNEPELQRLRRDIWVGYSIYSEPPGAGVLIRDYAANREDWESLGNTPMVNLRIPAGNFGVRIRKPGFAEVEGTMDSIVREFRRTLHPVGIAPPGMVFVPVDTFGVPSAGAVKARAFWLDKYEVTNRQFKEFVDRGEYRKPDHWKQPFMDRGDKGHKGRTLSWQEAMARFVDSTGQPGPATWELGSFAEGHGDDPVGGVSWYEAAAYADFAGKALPTIYHWEAAADFAQYSTILTVSNFRGEGPAPVGSYPGLGRFGTYDMAGNVTEWCWNLSGDLRWVRGGAWPDPNYMYRAPEAASPFARGATRGFRCAKYTSPLPETLTRPLDLLPDDDPSNLKPVGENVFRAYQSMYAYDRTDLKSRVESVDDTSPWWRKERVSYDAAYANERVIVFLFLPRNAAPPYQTILFFPNGAAFRERTSENLDLRRVDFLLRSGHAVAYPVYRGMYERHLAQPAGPNEARDLRIQWVKDIGRTIDYLETRSDLNRPNLAFYGISGGAGFGAIVLAVESRFKTGILQAGGLSEATLPDEIQSINFLPRVKIPVLMMNGRDDFLAPLEQSQIPMFRLLGTPEKDKRHVIFDSGHSVPRFELIKEVLPWLDRYLGPVKPKGP